LGSIRGSSRLRQAAQNWWRSTEEGWPREAPTAALSAGVGEEEEAPAIGRVRGRARERSGFARVRRKWWKAQFGERGVEHDEFEGEGRRVSFGHGQQTDDVAHVDAQKGERSEAMTSTSLGDSGSKQLRALTLAGGAARAVAALGQSAEEHIGYCRRPYPPHSVL